MSAGDDDFNRRFPNWNVDAKAYAEAMAALSPDQKRHANCDHAYGICADSRLDGDPSAR